MLDSNGTAPSVAAAFSGLGLARVVDVHRTVLCVHPEKCFFISILFLLAGFGSFLSCRMCLFRRLFSFRTRRPSAADDGGIHEYKTMQSLVANNKQI
jgi:hypothetical protein